MATPIPIRQQSVLDLLKKKYPEAFERWDHWDYKMQGPISLDDQPVVMVKLENKDGLYLAVSLSLENDEFSTAFSGRK